MKTADLIAYIEDMLYLGGGPSKKASHVLAVRLVNKLTEAGVLVLDDLVPASEQVPDKKEVK